MKPVLLSLLIASVPSLSLSEILLRRNGVLVDRSLVEKTEAKGKALEKDPAGDDLVLFQNGDLMHGTFGGLNNGLLWKRNDIDRPIRFGLPSVRQIVRKGGRSVKLHSDSSFFTLVSGDRIPGEIVSLDDKSLVIKSAIAGDLTIPRAHLKSITPNPFDGKLHYSGPYTSDGWVILSKEINAQKAESDKDEAKKPAVKKDEKPETASPWIHSGASFYNIGSSPLVFPDANLPDVGRFSFRVEWKGRLSMNLALLSDFTRVIPIEASEEELKPADGEEKEDQEEKEPEAPKTRKESLVDLRKGNHFQTIPWINPQQRNNALTFGSGYSMTLYSSYPYLSRNSFSKDGEPESNRMRTGRSTVSLSEQGDAHIEIRYDRTKALIMLYINGTYASQWSDLAGLPGDGKGFGIVNSSSSAKIKISDILITSWNGMKDNAKSMAHPERDVTLLVNGTDRFSGELLKIADGVAHLKSDYLTAQIPVADISKIILNKSASTDLEGEDLPESLSWNKEPVAVLYQPFGLIKLNPTSATPTSLTGTSPFLGEVKIDLSSSSLLRFTEGSPDLSDWFDDL